MARACGTLDVWRCYEIMPLADVAERASSYTPSAMARTIMCPFIRLPSSSISMSALLAFTLACSGSKPSNDALSEESPSFGSGGSSVSALSVSGGAGAGASSSRPMHLGGSATEENKNAGGVGPSSMSMVAGGLANKPSNSLHSTMTPAIPSAIGGSGGSTLPTTRSTSAGNSAGGIAPNGGASSRGSTTPSGGSSMTSKSVQGDANTAGGVTAIGGARASSFRNPLNTSHGSDPFMIHYEGYYYLAATTWGKTLTMKRGRTISELKAASTQVIWQDSTASRSGNMWAPEFFLLDNGAGENRWYHYYTAGDGNNLDTQRSYVLESEGTDPMGPYRYKAQLLNTWAIDGSLLQVDGKLYFMYSAWQGSTQNVWIQAMTNPWTLTGSRTLLTAPTFAWEQEGSDPVNEGPNALYHAGRIFVTYSASQCASPGYKLGLLELVASNPLVGASWVKRDKPVFQAANGAYGAGHNGFFRSPDGSEDWIVYHATDKAAGSCWTDRTTRIQRITWNADGTPNFGQPLALSTEIQAPAGE